MVSACQLSCVCKGNSHARRGLNVRPGGAARRADSLPPPTGLTFTRGSGALARSAPRRLDLSLRKSLALVHGSLRAASHSTIHERDAKECPVSLCSLPTHGRRSESTDSVALVRLLRLDPHCWLINTDSVLCASQVAPSLGRPSIAMTWTVSKREELRTALRRSSAETLPLAQWLRSTIPRRT